MIYELAGLRVKIENRCRYTSEFCKDYLSEDQSSPAAFEVAVTNEEFSAEKRNPRVFRWIYRKHLSVSQYLFADAEIRQIFVTFGSA